ncbi:MAG: glycosyltransferase [Clostridia bacterium]|nr:glycosyltransferase [Clostridia bacterium]
MHKRVLIVGTVPYNKKSTSRAFEAYFANWEKENLAQIFSSTKKPCKGHCETLFQITDKQMLVSWKALKAKTGIIYHYDDLEDEWQDNDLEVGNGAVKKMYSLGSKHTPLTHLLRGLLWRKKFWCTKKLNEWLDNFKPECVFLAFSDDYFIPQIALYVAKRYNVPIVSCIGDDYYFNTKFSISPAYYLYKYTYRHLIRKVFAHEGSAIYISDKIRDKYNSEFGLDGETVYLTSEIKRKEFAPFNKQNPYITYFGNIGMGRNLSLNDIATALGKINPEYKLHIYSNALSKELYEIFNDNPNAEYHGSIPYAEVEKNMARSDMTVVVEGFRKEDVLLSRYSLSTKAADALASGAAILAYGHSDCGIIEYLKSTGASAVCSDKSKLVDTISEFINDEKRQEEYYRQQIVMTKEHHNIGSSTKTFEDVVDKVIERMK